MRKFLSFQVDATGNGNIDNRADDVNYQDEDDSSLPIGLTTTWTTDASGSSTFLLILKHQPDLKTTTSYSNTGETDLNVEFEVNVN